MESKDKKEKKMPARQITVKIGQNDYEIKFPRNGALIDIESAKIRMTGGTNKEFVYGGPSAQNAYLLVEAIATFETLLPQMTKDLVVGSLLDLDQLQTKTVLKAYERYYQWMQEWRMFLNDDIEEKKEGDA